MDPFLTGDGEELIEALVEAAGILRRVGGVVVIGAIRREVAPEVFVTEQYGFKWNSYNHAERLKEPEADEEKQPEAEAPEPEPVEA